MSIQATLDTAKVDALLTRVQREVDEGLLPSAQVALGLHGEVVLNESFGSADDDSLICIFSATKGITSAAAWLLIQEGKLSEDELVVDIIPEFGANGKENITVQQLFTHTAGFPHAPFRPLQWNSKEETLGRFEQWRLSFDPGTKFEYHPTSSMWVIAEIIERKSGISYTEFVRTRVIEPLGLKNTFVGLPAEQNSRTLPVVHSGDPMTEEDYAKLGMPMPPVTEVTEELLLAFNLPEIRAVGVPGGGGYANAHDLALFYQALLHGGLDGQELWSASTLEDVRRIRSGDLTDMMFRKPANRALGIIISGDDSRSFRGFGKTNSPEAFGHNGAGGQLCWVDPASGLSLCYLTSGHDRNNVRQGRRGVAISSMAADCAG
ncbi:MAG: CubicO group peptidase (beta-lactamase class C family) [Limisphaerales bacterium]|jgi:CubicO group peptidase (beta-lactamase class C family)